MIPPNYSQEKKRLGAQLASWRDKSETGEEYSRRRAAYKEIREYMTGDHWSEGQWGSFGDTRELPSVQLMWQMCEMQLPKIFQGQNLRPSVIPESEGAIESLEVLRVIKRNDSQIQSQTPMGAAAELRSAILDYWWEKIDMESVLREGAQTAQWYRDAFFLDGMSGDDVFVDVVHPKDVRVDPDAKTLEDARFVMYVVPRTIQYIRQNYARYGKYVTPEVSAYRYREDDVPIDLNDEDQAIVELECWFIKDLATKSETEEETLDNPDQVREYQDDGWEIAEEIKGDVALQGPNGPIVEETIVRWEMRRTVDVPKYTGGWRKAVVAGGVVLDEGDNPSASGNLPLHHLGYYNTPGEFWSRGLPDQLKQLNTSLDEMVYESREVTKALAPFMIATQGDLEFQSAEQLGYEYGPRIAWLKPNATENNDVKRMWDLFPGAEIPQSFLLIMQQFQSWMEVISGSYDLRSANNLPQDSSGRFVEAVESSGNARISQIRDNVRRCIRSISENILANVIAYTDDEQTYRVSGGYGDRYMTVSPAELAPEDFEAKFDIVVGGSDSLPQNPIDRNQYIIQLVDSLSQKPEPIAMAELELMDIANKEGLRRALKSWYDSQRQQQRPAQDQDVAKRYHEGVSDILEDMAKKAADTAPALSLVIANELQKAARGGEPDLKLINNVIGPGVTPIREGQGQ